MYVDKIPCADGWSDDTFLDIPKTYRDRLDCRPSMIVQNNTSISCYKQQIHGA